MPPRIPRLQCLRASQSSPSVTFILPFHPFSSTSSVQAPRKQKQRSRDPYVIAQAAARKAANISRQAALQEQRATGHGDPVKGITTPFVQSFDTGLDVTPSTSTDEKSEDHVASGGGPRNEDEGINVGHNERLNNFLNIKEVNQRLKDSFRSSAPLPEDRKPWEERIALSSRYEQAQQLSPEEIQKLDHEEDVRLSTLEAERNKLHRQRHDNAVAAMAKIIDLSNGSSNDRARINTQRCIDTFGRHNTDLTLEPRPLSVRRPPPNVADPQKWVTEQLAKAKAAREGQIKERGGADTGSSEVQIAIITAKIRTLSQFLETRGKGDKAGKRNLRLLVHKRQKLLKYLWRKERGGARWQHCIQTLGLTEGTWKGEITL